MFPRPFTLTLTVHPAERGSYPVIARLADGNAYRGRRRLPTNDPDYQDLAAAVLNTTTPHEDEVIALLAALFRPNGGYMPFAALPYVSS